MMPANARRPSRAADSLLLGLAGLLLLVAYATVRYPASVSEGGVMPLAVTVVLLALYGGIALWLRTAVTEPMSIALTVGGVVGAVLGVLGCVSLTLEYFGGTGAAAGIGMWGLMFLAFGAAGSIAQRRTGSERAGVAGGVWAGLTYATLLCAFGFFLNLSFMSRMQGILYSSFMSSGMRSPSAYVVRSTVSSAATHLAFVPIVASICALTGASAGTVLRGAKRRLAGTLALAVVVLLVGGVWALGWVASLERSDRPPFVLLGLLSLGLGASCAHAVLSAYRHAARK